MYTFIFHNPNAYSYGIHVCTWKNSNKFQRQNEHELRREQKKEQHGHNEPNEIQIDEIYTLRWNRCVCYISAWVIYDNQKLSTETLKNQYNVFPRGLSFVCICRLPAVKFTFNEQQRKRKNSKSSNSDSDNENWTCWCGWCTVSTGTRSARLTECHSIQKTVIRTHKYRKNELLLWKRDRKLELFTLRHLHNGKQYFWIHCTCSPPPKQIFALEKKRDRARATERVPKQKHSSCACQFDKCYRIQRLSHTWLSSLAVTVAKRFVSISFYWGCWKFECDKTNVHHWYEQRKKNPSSNNCKPSQQNEREKKTMLRKCQKYSDDINSSL